MAAYARGSVPKAPRESAIPARDRRWGPAGGETSSVVRDLSCGQPVFLESVIVFARTYPHFFRPHRLRLVGGKLSPGLLAEISFAGDRPSPLRVGCWAVLFLIRPHLVPLAGGRLTLGPSV